jgi:hypothetical protein
MKDRILGHPSSIDAMVKLDEDTILTGASDGLIRVMQLYPTKVLGIVGEHPEFPIERMAADRTGRVLGTCSHDNTVKLWDIGYLRDEGPGDGGDDGDDDDEEEEAAAAAPSVEAEMGDAGSFEDDSDDAPQPAPKAKSRGKGKSKSKSGGGGGGSRGGFYEDM